MVRSQLAGMTVATEPSEKEIIIAFLKQEICITEGDYIQYEQAVESGYRQAARMIENGEHLRWFERQKDKIGK